MVIGKFYTTDDVADKTAGGDSYIRTKSNVVRGLAVTIDKNPEAPNIIIVGDGVTIKKNADLLRNTLYPVKTFIKYETNKWEYVGRYKVKKYSKSKEVIEKYREHREAKRVTGILFLEKKSD
jgi:hypothetical protein